MAKRMAGVQPLMINIMSHGDWSGAMCYDLLKSA